MNGVIALLKPSGLSSNSAVVAVRRILREKKAGHAGTLDPAAAGVLPICVGRSTRLSELLMTRRKAYIAEICFGAETDTQDAEGRVVRESAVIPDEGAIAAGLAAMTGELRQRPPMYSAVSVGGTRLYKLAAKGRTAEVPERTVSVYSAELLAQTDVNRRLIRIECGKGTYIRTIVTDLARSLGSAAHTSCLIRETAGGLHIDNAITLDELEAMHVGGDTGFLISPEAVLADMPRADIHPRHRRALDNGIPLPVTLGGEARIYVEGEFYGIGADCEDGMRLRVLLRDN